MAGVKGKCGGARPGAGRKPKPKGPAVIPVEPQIAPLVVEPQVETPGEPVDMLKLLQDVALGRLEATPLQVRAAIAAVQYTHTKRHDGGKREEDAEKAKKAGAGKFAPAAPPRLVSSR